MTSRPDAGTEVWLSEQCGRRRFLGLAGGLLAATISGGSLSACAAKEPLLRIGSNVWPGYELLYLAREKNYFRPERVRMAEMPSATVCMQALAAGSIEGACLTLDEVLTARSQGLDLLVVAVLDVSMGADALLANAAIDSLAKLKGKRVGVEQSAVGAVMLDAALHKGGLVPKDVKVSYLPANEHLNAFSRGDIDAVVTFEPVISQLSDKNTHTLFTSADVPGRIVDTLAVLPGAVKASPEGIRALIQGHFRARQDFIDDPVAVSPILARRLALPPANVPRAFQGLELPDAAENRRWFLGAPSKVETAAAALSSVMTKAQLLPRAVMTRGIGDARFLPSV